MNVHFTPRIEAWYEQNGRKLPWRDTHDPYRIWISEIILQQTRVAQGYDYYVRFLERFPNVESLAQAHEDEVLCQWQGLGYYSRARNLHAAAQQIASGGGFPQTFDEIKCLRGVGDYTAAAIASFAYDEPCAVVDGNVYRVLSRYLGVDTPIDTARGQKEFRALAKEMLDERKPALYNQAIMDFGALVCTPKSPACDSCPLVDTCSAFALGTQEALPVKSHKTQVRNRYFTYLYVTDSKGRLLLHRRGDGDIWQGLYELPLMETLDTLPSADEMEQIYPGCICKVRSLVHLLSHQRLHAQCYSLPCGEIPHEPFSIDESCLWIYPAELENFALPKLLLNILSLSSENP